MDLVQTIADLDESPELHVARLLVLIDAFSEGTKSELLKDSQSLPSSTFCFGTLLCLSELLMLKSNLFEMSSWRTMNATA